MPPVEELINDESDEVLLDDEGGEEAVPESPAAKPAATKDEAPPDAKSLREIRAELTRMRSSIEERDRALEFWRGKAEGSGKPKPEEDDDEPAPLEDDLVDAISSNDAKRVSKALKGLGFVSAKEVQNTIASTRASMTREAQLVQQFPDIADESSEFYKATAKHYKELVSDDPSLQASPSTLRTAAKLASAELRAKDGAEADRVGRVSRQSGTRSTRAATKTGSDELTPAQQRIVDNLRAAGSSITVEGYKKRAASGVRMAGIRRGR